MKLNKIRFKYGELNVVFISKKQIGKKLICDSWFLITSNLYWAPSKMISGLKICCYVPRQIVPVTIFIGRSVCVLIQILNSFIP